MQATNTSSSSSTYVSPISGPPVEKPAVTLADVLRGGAEQDRRSLQAYLHTLAVREKEKRKRKRMERKQKRSASGSSGSSGSSKKRRRSDAGSELTAPSVAGDGGNDFSNTSTPSGSIDMSASLMRGSVDLSAIRMGSTGYDDMRGSLDMSAMGVGGGMGYADPHHLHQQQQHWRSRSVDFGALHASAAAFDAMRGSIDMSAMNVGMGAHYSHHGSFANGRGRLSHTHHAFAHHHPSAGARHGSIDFGADISPTSSFSMDGPVFLEPAPLASFSSVDEHQLPSPPHQVSSAAYVPPVLPPQQLNHHHHQPAPMMPTHHHQPAQQPEVTELPEFDDFVSAAFLQSYPEEASMAAPFTPSALLLEPGVPEPTTVPQQQQQQQPAQPQPQHQFAVPAPPQQRTISPVHHQQQHQQHCSCPDCGHTASAVQVSPMGSSPATAALLSPPSSANFDFLAAAEQLQQHQPQGQASLGQQPFAVEEEQVENFLTNFIEWSEQCASSPLTSMPSPASSLYF